MKKLIPLLFSFPFLAQAQELKLGAYLDTYYAYDSQRPRNNERSFTTQPQRHNEPSLNLGFVDATLQGDRVRGRLALQVGNSVEKNTKNYVDEDNWARYIQESYLGLKLGEKTWLDAWIFLSHLGLESWVSRDNYTYTRSLNSDYVPYYSAGIRLEHLLNQKESFQLQVINGWQNMNENNDAKALGMQYKNILSEKLTFTYNNFLGDERVTTSSSRFRGYHNFILKYDVTDLWQTLSAFDLGHQSQESAEGIDLWIASTFTLRRILNQNESLSLRAEYYLDPHGANVSTGTPHGFEVVSSSMNYDRKLDEKILWRSELRGFYSKDEIYPESDGQKNRWNGLFVTSLTLWI